MKKRILIMAICAVIVMGFATPLSAQTPTTYTGAGSSTSNTNTTTASIFRNDVDNFVDYHKYSGVLKDAKWFSFLTGRNNPFTGITGNGGGGALDAGYARNIGSIYLGAWFRGNIFKTSANATETNTITPVWDDTHEILQQTTTATQYNAAFNETANNIEFLIGVAGHGIKIGFFESTSSNKNEGAPGAGRAVTVVDYLDGRKQYSNAIDEYSNTQSYLRPYLGWGSTFKIGSMGLRPYVDLGFGIYNSKQIDNYSNFEQINGVNYNLVSNVGAGRNEGYLVPNGTVGAWLDLAKKESVQQSIGLEYSITLYLYDNDAAELGSVDGTIQWNAGYSNMVTDYADRTETATYLQYNVNELSNISHRIRPRYKITGEPAENFKVGFQAALPVSFGSTSSAQYSKTIQRTATSYKDGRAGNVDARNTLNYNTTDTETSTFGVDLVLNLGASYQLIPSRFGLNAGITATPVRYSQSIQKTLPRTTGSIETHTVTQQDGSVTTNDKTVTPKTEADSVRESSVWSQYTATLYGGFTFNFNEHAALDLGVNSGGGSGDAFNLDLTTVNVIFTVKY